MKVLKEDTITLEGPMVGETKDYPTASLILDAIKRTTDSISFYETLMQNIEDFNYKEVIQSVINSESSILGVLQGLLLDVSPSAQNIMNGVVQAEQGLSESLEEGYSSQELIDAVQDAYGYNKKEAEDYIKTIDNKTKKELIKGFKDNAKKSFLADSLNKHKRENMRVSENIENIKDGGPYVTTIDPTTKEAIEQDEKTSKVMKDITMSKEDGFTGADKKNNPKKAEVPKALTLDESLFIREDLSENKIKEIISDELYDLGKEVDDFVDITEDEIRFIVDGEEFVIEEPNLYNEEEFRYQIYTEAQYLFEDDMLEESIVNESPEDKLERQAQELADALGTIVLEM